MLKRFDCADDFARCSESNFDLKSSQWKTRANILLRVIEGGRGLTPSVQEETDARSLIRAEGIRRLSAAGLEKFEARERLTGISIPRSLFIFKLQVEYTVEALSKLSPLPGDYTADGYWPIEERAAPSSTARFGR
jgi:hypothetical protein